MKIYIFVFSLYKTSNYLGLNSQDHGINLIFIYLQVLSLAGDALCIAATALRLATLPKTSSIKEDTNEKYYNTTPRLSPKAATTESCALHSFLPEISLAEVACHDHSSDCWIVVYDLVYDVTKFLQEVRQYIIKIAISSLSEFVIFF